MSFHVLTFSHLACVQFVVPIIGYTALVLHSVRRRIIVIIVAVLEIVPKGKNIVV